MLSKIKNNFFLYTIGSIGYGAIEVIYRGFTHWSMLITGGLCLLLVYTINEKIGKRYFFIKCALGALLITAMELLVGLIVNKLFSLNVWDYSTLPLNFLGQISLLFTFFWFLLCMPLILLCNFIKKKIFIPTVKFTPKQPSQ